MPTQSEKDFKPFHITYDCNMYNSDKMKPSERHIKLILDDSRIGINKDMPYVWVYEIGTTGKEHYHGYFYSSKSRNTIKKYLFEHTKEKTQLSHPDDSKYAKFEDKNQGVKGVEIYLWKGVTNHMIQNDDLKVIPHKIVYNFDYYGDIKNETSRSFRIRKKYEEQIISMKKYYTECKKINEDNKLTEYQEILKDLSEKSTMTPAEIKSYLVHTHYMKPKYIFNENSFKRIFLKIIREKNEILYREIINDRINDILRNSFNL